MQPSFFNANKNDKYKWVPTSEDWLYHYYEKKKKTKVT